MTKHGSTTSSWGKPEIQHTTNDVVVCNVAVPRPPGISPSQWIGFWEQVKKIN